MTQFAIFRFNAPDANGDEQFVELADVNAEVIYVAAQRADGRGIAMSIEIQQDGSYAVQLEEDGYTITDQAAVLRPPKGHPIGGLAL